MDAKAGSHLESLMSDRDEVKGWKFLKGNLVGVGWLDR